MIQAIENRIPSVLFDISSLIQEAGGHCCLVGGWVRDFLLDVDSKDYDVEVYGIDADVLDSILKKFGKPNHVGKAFGITLLVINGVQYDFAFPRTERKTDAGHKGFEVQTDPYMNFEQASSRRDFTINAMGLNLPELTFEDPWRGRQDLADKILRHVGPAFGEDPLRALRALQFAARFQLVVAPETVKICAEQDLSELSVERIEEEFRKLWLKSLAPGWGLSYMDAMNLRRFFPEWLGIDWTLLCAQIDHLATLNLGENALNRELQFYSLSVLGLDRLAIDALLLRVSRLRKILDEVPLMAELLLKIREVKSRLKELTEGEVRRFALRFPLSLSLPIARAAFLSEDEFNFLKEFGLRLCVLDKCPKPMLGGKDLITLGVKPGPQMGEWIQKIFELELDGELRSKEESIEWLKGQLGIDNGQWTVDSGQLML